MQRVEARRWTRMRRAVPTGFAGAVVLGAAACTGASSGPTTGAGPSLTASPAASSLVRVTIDLPGAVTALTATDAGLLLGTYAVAATPRAGLTLLDPAVGSGSGGSGTSQSGSVGRPVSVTASTAYGREGSWRALAASGDRVLGIAGEVGGAHGNVRWTIWRGGLAPVGGRVTEEKQEFWTFGGYDMGGLSGVGFGAGQPVVVGGWKSSSAGLDIATWRARERTWVRADSTGSALASTTSRLVAATAVIPDRSSAILLGSTTLLGQGMVQVIPSIWTTSDSVAPNAWRRSDLPTGAAAGAGSVVAGGCEGATCLLAGRIGDRLALWRWDGRAASTVTAPEVPLGEQDRIVGVGLAHGRPWLVVARTGTPAAKATASTSTTGQAPATGGWVIHSAAPLTQGQPAWRIETTPADSTPTAAGAAGGRFWMATDAPTLWASP